MSLWQHLLCSQLVEQRGGLQRILKALADGDDAHIIVTDAERAEKLLLGAVSDLRPCDIGQDGRDAFFVLVHGEHLMVHLAELLGDVPAEPSCADQKN